MCQPSAPRACNRGISCADSAAADWQVCTIPTRSTAAAQGRVTSRQDLGSTTVDVASRDREGRGVFERIAVVNRGEPALRLTRAVRELNAELGTRARVVALHTEAERRATVVRAAAEAGGGRGTGGAPPPLPPTGTRPAPRGGGAPPPPGGGGAA